MKYLTLLFFLVLFCTSADCQYREKLKKDKFNSAKFNTFELEISKKRFDKLEFYYPINFSFVDARADKGKLGFVRVGNGNEFSNMIFPKEATEYINSRVSGASKGTDGKKLLVVIRHFWLSQMIVQSSALKTMMLMDSKGYLSFCYFSGDFYLENNGQLQYLGRQDTITKYHRWMGNVANDLVNNTLENAMDFGDSLAAHMPAATAFFDSHLLNDSLGNQFNYPILKTSHPAKGIYLTYEDFLNDLPLQEEFELKEHRGDEYLQAQKTDTSITNKAWGYSDGEHIFKHLNDEYYLMLPVQNTFEVAGPRIIRKTYKPGQEFFVVAVATFLGGLMGGVGGIWAVLVDKSIMKELVPYQLNIRNGTFY